MLDVPRGGLGGARLRRRAVPAAGGGRGVDGGLRLRFDGKGLDREPGGRERLGVQPFRNIVTLVRRVRVALRRCQAEPFEGFGEVLFDADAAGIEDTEVELAVGNAAVGGFAEPFRGALVVGALAAAIGVEHGEVMHRLGVAALGRLQIIAPRDVDILFYAKTLLVEGPEPEHRRYHAGLRRAVIPFGGFVEIDRHAFAFGETGADLVGGGRIAVQDGGAQYRTRDAFGQPLGRRHLNEARLAAGGHRRRGRNSPRDVAGAGRRGGPRRGRGPRAVPQGCGRGGV